jgi:DNA polymerase-3 subunit delta
MKLSARDIDAFLKQPSKVAGALIYGPDQGLVSTRARDIANLIISPADQDFNRTELTEEQLVQDEPRLADELCAMSLMGGRRLIWLRDAGDKSGAIVKQALAQLPANIPAHEQHYLLVSAAELTPRSALRVLFEQEQTLAAVPCYKQEGASVTQVIRSKLDAAGLRHTPEVMTYLATQLTGDRMIIESELDKIILYYGANSQIEIESLRELIVSSQEVALDRLTHAFAGGQLGPLLRDLDEAIISGMQPIMCLRSIDRLLARLQQIAQAMQEGKSAEQAISSARPPIFFKDKALYQQYLRRWNSSALLQARHQLMLLEADLKLHHETSDLRLKDGLLRLAGKALKAAA